VSNWSRDDEPKPPNSACVLCKADIPHERHITALEASKLGIVIKRDSADTSPK
jgi:hypothetical protein